MLLTNQGPAAANLDQAWDQLTPFRAIYLLTIQPYGNDLPTPIGKRLLKPRHRQQRNTKQVSEAFRFLTFQLHQHMAG